MDVGAGIAVAGSVIGIAVPLTALIVRVMRNGNEKYVRVDMCEERSATVTKSIDEVKGSIDKIYDKIDFNHKAVLSAITNSKRSSGP